MDQEPDRSESKSCEQSLTSCLSKRVSNIEQPVRRLYPEIALLNSLTRSGGGQFEGIVFGDGIRGAPAFRIKSPGSHYSTAHPRASCAPQFRTVLSSDGAVLH